MITWAPMITVRAYFSRAAAARGSRPGMRVGVAAGGALAARARHTETEHGDSARLGVAERFEVNPVEGRGRKADPVAQEHREDIDQDLVDEPSLQALAGQVGAEDLQVLAARGA